MSTMNYQKLNEKENQKLKKEVDSLATKALKDGIISNEDYQKLTNKHPSSDSKITELLNTTDKLKEFVPKLKNRISKRKNCLNDCERKLKSLSKDTKLDLSEVKNSFEKHSIFDRSDFLKDLTATFNKHFETAVLFEDFLKKNDEFIESNPTSSVNRICLDFNINAQRKKQYKKWLLKYKAMEFVEHYIENNPEKAKDYISQMEISLSKLGKFYEWLKSSSYLPSGINDKLKVALKEYAKKIKLSLKSSDIEGICTNEIPKYFDQEDLYVSVFERNVCEIIETLNCASDDFTYDKDIKPLVRSFKDAIKDSFEKMLAQGHEIMDRYLPPQSTSHNSK